jgi:hypothetical protein
MGQFPKTKIGPVKGRFTKVPNYYPEKEENAFLLSIRKTSSS